MSLYHLKTSSKIVTAFVALSAVCLAQEVEHQEVDKVVASAEIISVLPTGSMRPALDENCYLLTVKIPYDQLRVNDVIIFRTPHAFHYMGKAYTTCCHRIIAMSKPHGWFLVTKGDHNDLPDAGYVTEDSYVTCVLGCVQKDRLP